MKTKPVKLKPVDLKAIARLLDYSWTDIYFEYERLTKHEKSVISKASFARINKWMDQLLGEKGT